MRFAAYLSHAVHMGRYSSGKAVNSIQIFAPPIGLPEDGFDIIGCSKGCMIFNES